MKAMIMAAGVGSRLMPMTTGIPKPMMPMMNRPLMVHTIELLARHGFRDIVLNLHYKGDIISGYFGDGHEYGVNLTYSWEPELLGTAGGVKKCQAFLDETFLVVSGDALTDADLGGLMQAHRRQGALATIALKEVEEVESFGIVVRDDAGHIKSFQEKPTRAEALGCTANTGIYVFEPEIFRLIPEAQFYDFGSQVFPHLVSMGAPFFGAVMPQYWCDIGCLEVYRQAHADILDGRVEAVINGQMAVENPGCRVIAAAPVEIGSDVRWEGTVVLGAGCRIDNGAYIKDSVIWNDTIIEAGAAINRAIIGHHCHIGRNADIKPGSAMDSYCSIEENCCVEENGRVFARA